MNKPYPCRCPDGSLDRSCYYVLDDFQRADSEEIEEDWRGGPFLNAPATKANSGWEILGKSIVAEQSGALMRRLVLLASAPPGAGYTGYFVLEIAASHGVILAPNYDSQNGTECRVILDGGDRRLSFVRYSGGSPVETIDVLLPPGEGDVVAMQMCQQYIQTTNNEFNSIGIQTSGGRVLAVEIPGFSLLTPPSPWNPNTSLALGSFAASAKVKEVFWGIANLDPLVIGFFPDCEECEVRCFDDRCNEGLPAELVVDFGAMSLSNGLSPHPAPFNPRPCNDCANFTGEYILRQLFETSPCQRAYRGNDICQNGVPDCAARFTGLSLVLHMEREGDNFVVRLQITMGSSYITPDCPVIGCCMNSGRSYRAVIPKRQNDCQWEDLVLERQGTFPAVVNNRKVCDGDGEGFPETITLSAVVGA